MNRLPLLRVVWVLVGFVTVAPAADPKPEADVKAIIDSLTELERQDTGYSGSDSGTAFLPLGRNERGAALLSPRQGKFGSSDAMKSLVKLGVKAVPTLLDHLSDDRKTKILIDCTMLFGALEEEPKYAVRVGDLCYVALGQIVNRDYTAVKYIPTAIVDIANVSKDKELREQLAKEWGKLTAESHQKSLAKDLDSDRREVRNGASVRLAYYYPDALEPLVLKQFDRSPPLGDHELGSLIDALRYDRSEKIDKAIRDIMAKTDDDYMGFRCLGRLVGRGYDADIAAFVKRRMPKTEERYQKYLKEYESKIGWTWLHKAVELDVPELIDAALKDKLDVNAQGKDGRTALHLAAADGKLAAVERVLAAKADPNVKDMNGKLAVQLAAFADHPEVVRRLVAAKSVIPDALVAATAGDADRLAALLKEKGERAKERTEEGFTPLHLAAREGHEKAVAVLLDAGAEVNTIDAPTGKYSSPDGWTPLHLAVLAEKPAVVKLLLARKADANAADQRGKLTPLHYAAWVGNLEVVTALLDGKADRGAKDEKGRTPLDLAKERKHAAVVKLLEAGK